MHSYLASIKLIIYFLIFQAFFVIKTSYSDHLTAKITGFVDASSPIHILGYDRKYYFEENSAPLFIVVEKDINNFNMINLKAFPHINIGLFAFQDTDGNGEFSRDFKASVIFILSIFSLHLKPLYIHLHQNHKFLLLQFY